SPLREPEHLDRKRYRAGRAPVPPRKEREGGRDEGSPDERNGVRRELEVHGHVVADLVVSRYHATRSATLADQQSLPPRLPGAKLAEKGKIAPGEREAALARITLATDLTAAADCRLVVEAAVESLAVKAEIFRELDRITAPDAILASNTSSISITKLGATTKRP